jgi:GH25 family lysozyme M1 (1,4-beta-N-acetylmuramidase)
MDISRHSIDVYHGDAYTGKTLPNGQYEMVGIEWLKTGFKFAFMKSSQGISWKDPAFDLQWKSAEGLKRVAYHFLEPDADAIKQAQNFQKIVQPVLTDNDYIAVDFEDYRPGGLPSKKPMLDRAKWLGSFLYETGKWLPDAKRTFIYTGWSYWYPCGGLDAGWAKDYRLWNASWYWDNYFLGIKLPPFTWTPTKAKMYLEMIESGEVTPPIVKPWTKTDVWQWTARYDPAQINGYNSNKKAVDHDVILDLDLLGTPAPPQYCPTCGQIIP